MFESVEDNSYVKTVQCQFPVSSSSRPRSGRPMTPSVDKISEPSETRATWWWCPVITHYNCHNSSIFLVPEMSDFDDEGIGGEKKIRTKNATKSESQNGHAQVKSLNTLILDFFSRQIYHPTRVLCIMHIKTL